MNKRQKMILLNQDEKDQSIALILKEVNLKPVTFRAFIGSFFQEVGFRYLFWGLGDILYIVGLLLLGVGALYLPDLNSFAKNGHVEYVYFAVFMISPLCYALLYFLGMWKEKLLGTFELKMTLKVSLKEILILRMFMFSGISLIVSTIGSVFIWQLIGQELSLMKLFSLSFASLFLFASMQLLLEFQLPMRCHYWVTPMIWAVIGILFIWKKDLMTQILLYLPLSLIIAISFGFILLFIYLLRYNYLMQKEGTIYYANA
ncbi:hypothetical protein [Shouchella lehensis]|uniref:Uncharacterized protein n=1 Tax=Shouchella lehensis G1 TaxID=1246626 RepID=A0A060M7S4_9BACI|nr:hypothetical protein [Shouchella lehensis]AIC96129.1 hypothetical protein BleG1_3582 [Shouchella lehensis G1]